MSLKTYVDTGVYNRPFGDQAQLKIVLETQALFMILQLIETEAIELIHSFILDYENSQNPFSARQQ